MNNRTTNRILSALGIIVLIIVFVAALRSGAVSDFLSYDCRRAAEAMQVNWMWDPSKGCFIQQPNGSWLPIDANPSRANP